MASEGSSKAGPTAYDKLYRDIETRGLGLTKTRLTRWVEKLTKSQAVDDQLLDSAMSGVRDSLDQVGETVMSVPEDELFWNSLDAGDKSAIAQGVILRRRGRSKGCRGYIPPPVSPMADASASGSSSASRLADRTGFVDQSQAPTVNPLIRTDGSYFHVESQSAMLRNPEGEFENVGWAGILSHRSNNGQLLPVLTGDPLAGAGYYYNPTLGKMSDG